MQFYVYILFRPWDMTPCYVGKGKGRRLRTHQIQGINHPNKRLGNIFRRAGSELPSEIVFETNDENEAFAKEIELIALYGRSDLKLGRLCNCTDGGDGSSGIVVSEETRKKMSLINSAKMKTPDGYAQLAEARKAMWSNPEYVARHAASVKRHHSDPDNRRKRSAAAKERCEHPDVRKKLLAAGISARSPEAIAKKSASLKAKWLDPEYRTKTVAAQKGRVNSPDTRAKISASHKGKVFSPEHRANLSRARLAISDETRAKMRLSQAARWARAKAISIPSMEG